MLELIFIIVIVLGIIGIIAGAVYWRYRTVMREAKAYERGLKMVPLLIHLPPSSDDIEVGSRDVRDVTEETISKATTLYNVIASTVQSGFKSNFYGQRHISFEIVSSKGLIHYFVAVPLTLVPVVQQAVLSAYPTARLEEVEDHNIFSPVGRLAGTVGGEFTLKENYAQPIAIYTETKRDAMQSLLNAIGSLTAEEGAAVQILVRPAHKKWAKNALATASRKKSDKGKSSGGGLIWEYLRAIPAALVKPPEAGEKKPVDKQLSNLEQSHIDAIEEKTRHPGYENLIWVVASSENAARSQTILSNIVASFALYDSPGKNGFSFSPAKNMESFVTSYIFRFFPASSNKDILNSVELATIFHLPDQRSTPTGQLERQASKQVDGPPVIPEEGQLLGYNVYPGEKKEIRLSPDDRRRHLYIVGQTGTGKSVLLENLALQDILDGRGFAFIDPHGDAVERLLAMVPKERTEDVIYFSPADMEYPLGLNLFEFDTPDQKDFLIQEAINMLYKLYDPQHQGIIGPRYEHWFRNAALTLMADPVGSTFIDIPKVFTDAQYAKQKLKYVTDLTVQDFWNKEMAKTSDYHKSEVLGWFVSKFGAFMSNEMMRNIIGQTKSSFDLRKVMDEGKILLVNLSKGRTGELNSKLLGMIFVMKFQAAAMSRASLPEEQRRDFSLYVDEFQNFSTDSFATILSEARKYRLNLIVANQFIGQLTEEIRDAVFGNVGSVVSLRTGATDADFLVKQFAPVFDTEDLVKLPNYNSVVRLMINGVPSQPFSMMTIPPLGKPNPQLSQALKRLSYAKYGRPRAIVEKEIFDRLRTEEPPRPASPFGGGAGGFGSRQPSPFGTPGRRPAGLGQSYGSDTSMSRAGSFGAPRRPNTPSPPTFLDQWLARRGAKPSASRTPAAEPRQPRSEPPESPPQPVSPPEEPPAHEPPKQAEPAAPDSSPAAAPARPAPSEPRNSDDMYIDKDGVIHYDAKNQAAVDTLDTGLPDREDDQSRTSKS